MHMIRLDIAMDEILYRPGSSSRFTPDAGIPPLLLVTLPHLTDEPEALFDEIGEYVRGLGPAPIGDQYRRLFGWMCGRLGRALWVERSGGSITLLPHLLAHFPDARFVHMYRDGRECAISMSRHHGYRLSAIVLRMQRRLGVDPFGSDWRPRGQIPRELRPFLPETFDRDEYLRLEIPPEEFGRLWSGETTAGLAHLSELPPHRVRHLRYERLVESPAAELDGLNRFLGLPDEPEWIARASALTRPAATRWPLLPDEQRRRLDRACREALGLLYGPGDPIEAWRARGSGG